MADDSTADTDTPTRGAFKFEVGDNGALANSAQNVNLLRNLWLNRTLVKGDDLGPGDPGDFDNGGWHSSCHLLGAGGVRRTADGRLVWLELSHDPVRDQYYCSATCRGLSGIQTVRADSAEGRILLAGSTLLGLIEGNSTGRTSARGVSDAPDLFNLWRRQDFDEPISSTNDGGKVWEHWCTTRDLRATHRIGTSVLTAYVSLVAATGDLLPAAVARGRREYGHPTQLCAAVHAGFVSEQAAVWGTSPLPIPTAAERLLLEAEPAVALLAVEQLDWSKAPSYYMFSRRIKSWSSAAQVKDDLKKFKPK
ncbi:MAG TPA: hypothetical protein VH592_01160 [Gemmataceae bacterium]|jgi:hypothetical protein